MKENRNYPHREQVTQEWYTAWLSPYVKISHRTTVLSCCKSSLPVFIISAPFLSLSLLKILTDTARKGRHHHKNKSELWSHTPL